MLTDGRTPLHLGEAASAHKAERETSLVVTLAAFHQPEGNAMCYRHIARFFFLHVNLSRSDLFIKKMSHKT